MTDDALLNNRVDHLDHEVHSLNSRMSEMAVNVSGLVSTVQAVAANQASQNEKLDRLISQSGRIQGKEGQISEKNVQWALGFVISTAAIGITTILASAALIMHAVNQGDEIQSLKLDYENQIKEEQFIAAAKQDYLEREILATKLDYVAATSRAHDDDSDILLQQVEKIKFLTEKIQSLQKDAPAYRLGTRPAS